MGIKKDGKLITPYIHFPMEKGKVYEDKEMRKLKKILLLSKKNAVLILDMGIKSTMGFFIHLKMKMMRERHVLVLAGKC